MKTNFGKMIFLILLFFILPINAQGKYGSVILNKNFNRQTYRININNISTIFHNDGRCDIDGDGAFWYPKGSNKSCFYESGFIWIGKMNSKVIMGGSTFSSGLVPGKVGQNPDDSKMFRVRPDWKFANFESEIADNEGTFDEIKNKYENDWYNWPWQDGAPFEDINEDGIYDPEIDIAGVPGADQTIYFIANSSDALQTLEFYKMEKFDIEIRFTIWAYNSKGPLRNAIFKKYQVINYEDEDIEEVYAGIWSDPDIGRANDDFVGCDTTLNLGYAYNGKNKDPLYDLNAPAAGFVILGLNDFGVGNKIYNAFTDNYLETNINTDYDLQYKYSVLQYWQRVRGLHPRTGEKYFLPDELGGGPTKFLYSGDPFTGKGYIENVGISPYRDKRFLMASIPTTLKSKDTLEVIIAQIAAGGENKIGHLEAINHLKKTAYNTIFLSENKFQIPDKPKVMDLTATPLENKIILNWEDSPEIIDEVENQNNCGYSFQGYKIFQFPDENSSIEDAKIIAVFDKIDGIKKILQKEYNEEVEGYQNVLIHNGNDNGVQRHLVIERDYLNDTHLYKGTEYYFGLSAYSSLNDERIYPASFESEIKRVSVIPKGKKPGLVIQNEFGSEIDVERISGNSDGQVFISVVEPENVTGDNYLIQFEKDTNSVISWSVKNIDKNKIIVDNRTNQKDNNEFPLVDGLLVKVINPEFRGVKEAYQIKGDTIFSSENGAGRFQNGGFNGTVSYSSLNHRYKNIEMMVSSDSLKTVVLKMANVENPEDIDPDFDTSQENVSNAYRYVYLANQYLSPEQKKYVTNTSSPFAYQDYKKSVPLSVWDISDPVNPRRLSVGFFETIDSRLDGKYWPGYFEEVINGSFSQPFEWLMIFDKDYSQEPDTALMKDIYENPLPVAYWCTFARQSKKSWLGDEEFMIVPYKINGTDDVFSFKAPEVYFDKELAKEDSKEINVFPNPYYAYNSLENSFNERFVKINHLPEKAVIRIYDLAGKHIKTIFKEDQTQFVKWNLTNSNNKFVSSGLYILHITLTDIETTKILKLGVIQR